MGINTYYSYVDEVRLWINPSLGNIILSYATLFVGFILTYLFVIMFLNQNKKTDIFKGTIISIIYKKIREVVSTTNQLINKIPLIKKVLIISVAWTFIVTFVSTLLYITFLEALAVPVGIVIGIWGVIFVLVRNIGDLQLLIEGTKRIKDGELDYKINVKQNSYISDLVEDINNIGQGLENSIDNQLRSERMKSELITNVSHDLKTPLTSIINYVELIKKEEDLSPEHIRDYVNVLDAKSKRLKVLIEDLFEASKASSGNIELNMEKIDIKQLLNQAIGEMDEKLHEANLNLKVSYPEEKIYIKADGRRLYRVLENLISNISKYSLNGTRVYIDLHQIDNKVILIMKNISSYELNFDPSEITERFKRADESRNTEGSGLGLSIAKDLVKIQGGEFYIEIDGDLFKSTVEFKTYNS